VNTFLQAIRRHGWDTSLPPSTMFFPEDYPKGGEKLPPALAEHVMAQVEDPANLARQGNPAYRLITIILIRCGLRVSDAIGLPFDCVVRDADGAPYLRYYNRKMKREALVPIDDELQALIGDQQNRARERWLDGTPVLFPRPTPNIDGHRPVSYTSYRDALYRWLEDCDVRDEHGQPVHLTLLGLLDSGQKDAFNAALAQAGADPKAARTFAFRARPYGMTDPFDVFTEVRKYQDRDVAAQVTTPLLITDPDNEQFFPGQPRQLYDLLPGEKEIIEFTQAQGANFHCQPTGRQLTHTQMLDWLADHLPSQQR
jgi:hypothetical protein